MDFGHWTYNGSESDCEGKLGFVYLLTHRLSGCKYVGIKQMRSKFRRPPLKGKKRKRVAWKDTDWRTYTSSSGNINAIIEKEGIHAFDWEILSFHNSKSAMKWEELKIQVNNDVLRNDQWINGIVNVRLSKIAD